MAATLRTQIGALVAGAALAVLLAPSGLSAAGTGVPGASGVVASQTDDPGAPSPQLTPLKARSSSAGGRVAPRSLGSTRVSSVSAPIVVTYHGFPSAARASFQRAVDLWSVLVDSDVTIRIDATWKVLPTGVLGGAGAADYVRDFPGAPRSGTWYPIALANAVSGTDLSPEPDVIAEFASNRSDWYFGTDGAVAPNQMDFTTVVLHEIGHGLGITDSTNVSGGVGSFGAGSGRPFVYERFAQGPTGTALASYPNDSASLASALQSDGLRWGGAQAVAANGSVKPYLYSPFPYEPGSSVAHLDETRYATGTPNALMTPYLDDGEAVHDPGDIALGMMRDMGWKTVGAKGLPASPAITTALAGEQRVILAWTPPKDTGRQFLTGYRIHRYTGSATVADATYDVGATSTSTSITGLTDGTGYRFTVSARNLSGFSVPSAKSGTITPTDLGPFSRSDAFVRQQFLDFLGREPTAAENLSWLDQLHRGVVDAPAVVAGIAALAPSKDPSTRMTRLYSAYFLRLPDYGGYTYWVGRLRGGSSLKRVSDTFSASSEFTNRYGSLSDRSFVTLVYQNVLGRAPDKAGLDYWVGKLARRSVSRGQVMLNFSESSENVRKMDSKVTSVLLRSGMLRRMPTAGEYTADVLLLDGPAVAADLAAALLGSAAYDARIP